MMKRNKEKIIIVSGGSGLIGKAIMNHLLSQNLIPINIDLAEPNFQCEYFKCDITDEIEIKLVFKSIYEKYGRIDGLVNNAYPRKKEFAADFKDVKEKNLVDQLHFQLASYYLCCQQVIPYMKKSGSGSIVNISSIYGTVGNDFSLYKGTNPYMAINGNIQNDERWPNSACTSSPAGGWWEVDLGKEVNVKSIVVYNRPDCCQERLKGATLTLIDRNHTTVHSETLNSSRRQVFKIKLDKKLPFYEWIDTDKEVIVLEFNNKIEVIERT